MVKIWHYGLFLGHIKKKSKFLNACKLYKANRSRWEKKLLLCPKQSTFRKHLDKIHFSIIVGVINSFNILKKIMAPYYSHKIGHKGKNMDSLSIIVSDDLEKVS